MKVYYSGYGFIYDSFFDDENYSDSIDTIKHLKEVSQHKYDGQFVLSPHITESLKIIGSTMVDFLLYENDPEVIPVPLYGVGVFAKTARLYLSDNEGNLCPIKIQNVGGVFEDKQSGNTLKLLYGNETLQPLDEQSTIKPKYTHASELMQLMDKAIVEFWENHDSENPPTEDDVVPWLQQEWLIQENAKLSTRSAKAIDLIMRPLRYK